MTREAGPNEDESLSTIALYGGLIGIAAAALHQIHHAITNDIPANPLLHVISEVIAGAVGGAILFAAVPFLRSRFKGRP